MVHPDRRFHIFALVCKQKILTKNWSLHWRGFFVFYEKRNGKIFSISKYEKFSSIVLKMIFFLIWTFIIYQGSSQKIPDLFANEIFHISNMKSFSYFEMEKILPFRFSDAPSRKDIRFFSAIFDLPTYPYPIISDSGQPT